MIVLKPEIITIGEDKSQSHKKYIKKNIHASVLAELAVPTNIALLKIFDD